GNIGELEQGHERLRKQGRHSNRRRRAEPPRLENAARPTGAIAAEAAPTIRQAYKVFLARPCTGAAPLAAEARPVSPSGDVILWHAACRTAPLGPTGVNHPYCNPAKLRFRLSGSVMRKPLTLFLGLLAAWLCATTQAASL